MYLVPALKVKISKCFVNNYDGGFIELYKIQGHPKTSADCIAVSAMTSFINLET